MTPRLFSGAGRENEVNEVTIFYSVVTMLFPPLRTSQMVFEGPSAWPEGWACLFYNR